VNAFFSLLAVTPPVPINPTVPQTTTSPTTTTAQTGLQFPSILLGAIVLVTFVAFLVVLFMPERSDEQRARVRVVGLSAAGISFFLTAFFGMLVQIGLAEGGGTNTANEENYPWFRSFAFSSNFHLTADGISLALLILSTVVFACVFFHSWKVHERVRLYIGMLLLLETAVNGVLCSADYVLLLIFWGMQVLPLYLLIRVYGGTNRLRAAQRYLTFSLVSLMLLTLAVVLVIVKAKQGSSDISQDYQTLLGPVETAGFWLSFAAFAISIGVFPVHRWMIDAHSEAPPGVAAIASGVLIRLGAYGMIRMTLGQFPHASHQFSLAIVALAVVSTIWGAVAALGQDDVRRFISYGNVAQMGMVLLAIGTQTSIALEGAVLLMIAHGFAAAMLTMLAGSVEERTRTRSIRALGGLAAQMPRTAAFWMFAVFTVIGVPLLAGFVADFMLFSGAFPVHRVATVLVMIGVLIATGGMLWLAHRIFFGPVREAYSRARDASTLELTYLLPICAAALLFGVRIGAVTPVLTNGVIDITTRLNGG
jgi:NADH-quinone oxidoreductase subunit M